MRHIGIEVQCAVSESCYDSVSLVAHRYGVTADKGNIKKELPISVDIKYYLDGKEISAKKLEGKKGNVKIVYSFKNNSYDIISLSTYQYYVLSAIRKLVFML